MMSALHLVWIIPLAGCFGFVAAALLAANESDNKIQKGEPACKQ